MMNCKDATQLMSARQERELTLGEKMTLKLHLMMCSGCRNFGDQMKTLRNVTRVYAKGKDSDQHSSDSE